MELTDKEQLEVNEFSTKYPTIYKMMQVQAKDINATSEQVLKIAELQNKIMDNLLKINKKIDKLDDEVSRLKKNEQI